MGGLRRVAGSMEQAPVWAVWTLAGVAAAVALLWKVERRAHCARAADGTRD